MVGAGREGGVLRAGWAPSAATAGGIKDWGDLLGMQGEGNTAMRERALAALGHL